MNNSNMAQIVAIKCGYLLNSGNHNLCRFFDLLCNLVSIPPKLCPFCIDISIFRNMLTNTVVPPQHMGGGAICWDIRGDNM